MSEIQKVLNYPRGGGGAKPNWEFSPNFSGFFATAPTVSAVAKDPHFFSFSFFFVGPLSDWSGQTLLFSYWSTQTECSTHACSSQQSCVAHCTHLSADGFSTW